MNVCRAACRRVNALIPDARGTVIVEFAIVLPVILLLFLGGYQLCDAIACKRKATTAVRAIADLTTRLKVVGRSDVDTILNAATQVMTPYPLTPAFVRVSQVYTNASGATTVSWSRAVNGTKRTTGSSITLPGTIGTRDTYMIFSEISYAYDPGVRFRVVGPLTFTDTIFMSPRLSPLVTCDDC